MNCKNIIKTTNVTVTGTAPNQVLTLTVPSTVTSFVNLEKYKIVICQAIPVLASPLAVKLNNGTTTWNMLTNSGNLLQSDQVKTRKCYTMIYGNNPSHLTILNCLNKTSCLPV